MKKQEGKAFDLTDDQKVLEVGKETTETKVDNKTDFETFKNLYDGKIKEKCKAEYGTDEDKDLLEDTAKEMFLSQQEYIPSEDTKSEGDIVEEKTKQTESKDIKTEKVNIEEEIHNVQEEVDVLDSKIMELQNLIDNYDGERQNVVDEWENEKSELIQEREACLNEIRTLKQDKENREKRRKDMKSETKLQEGFFNLYKSYDELYGIGKYTPTELKKFLDGLKEGNRISDKDYNCLKDFADKYQSLIDSTGYESTLGESKLEEDQYENERRRGKPNTRRIAEMEYYDNKNWYENHKEDFKDLNDFTEKNAAELASEYNLSVDAANDVCVELYKLMTNHLNVKTESMELDDILKNDNSFKYQLLGRMDSDCRYFLGNGHGSTKHLWANDVDKQIEYMKAIYNSFSEDDKPDWISIEDIDKYGKEMKALADSKKTEESVETDNDYEHIQEFEVDGNKYYVQGIDDEGLPYFETEDGSRFASIGPGRRHYNEFNQIDLDEDEVVNTDLKFSDIKNSDEIFIVTSSEDNDEMSIFKFSEVFGDKLQEDKTESKEDTEEYKNFIKDMESMDKAITSLNDIEDPNAKSILEVVMDTMNKLWIEKEQNVFGIKYQESKLQEGMSDQDKLLATILDKVVGTLQSKYNVKATGSFETGNSKEAEVEIKGELLDILDAINFLTENIRNESVDVVLPEDIKDKTAVVKIVSKIQESIDIENKEIDKEEKLEEGKDIKDIASDILITNSDSYREVILEMGLSKEDFIDMITTENEHELQKDEDLTDEQEKEVYSIVYDNLV